MGDLPAAVWRKSSWSNANGCVEVAVREGGVAVRDSKDAAGPVLRFTAAEWERFLRAIRRRMSLTDRADGRVQVAVVDGAVTLRRSGERNGPVLVFTLREWEAFLGGVGNGEFELARLASVVGRR